MALAGGGSFRTTKPSLHATTNATVIQRFLPVPIHFQQETDFAWSVVVSKQWTTSTVQQGVSHSNA
jgi:RNA 3'-terminal phosphate cyclase (ATP)